MRYALEHSLKPEIMVKKILTIIVAIDTVFSKSKSKEG